MDISLNGCKDDTEIVEENYSLDDMWRVILEYLQSGGEEPQS